MIINKVTNLNAKYPVAGQYLWDSVARCREVGCMPFLLKRLIDCFRQNLINYKSKNGVSAFLCTSPLWDRNIFLNPKCTIHRSQLPHKYWPVHKICKHLGPTNYWTALTLRFWTYWTIKDHISCLYWGVGTSIYSCKTVPRIIVNIHCTCNRPCIIIFQNIEFHAKYK